MMDHRVCRYDQYLRVQMLRFTHLLQLLGQLWWMNVVLQHFDSAILRLIDVNESRRDDFLDQSVVIGQTWIGLDFLLNVVTAVVPEDV
jgi:hypothetical protein